MMGTVATTCDDALRKVYFDPRGLDNGAGSFTNAADDVIALSWHMAQILKSGLLMSPN